MKNTTETVLNAVCTLLNAVPKIEGTPTPEQVAEILSIAEGMAKGLKGLDYIDYKFQDCSGDQDGSYMCHVLEASFSCIPWVITSVHNHIPVAFMSFVCYLKEHNRGDLLHCIEIHDKNGIVDTDVFLSETACTDIITENA